MDTPSDLRRFFENYAATCLASDPDALAALCDGLIILGYVSHESQAEVMRARGLL